MEYLAAACTDVGIKKSTNQDSLTVKIADTSIGKIAMVVMCDGMGGLAQGEVASAEVINEFSEWFQHRLPIIIEKTIENSGFNDIVENKQKKLAIDDYVIRNEWNQIIQKENSKISEYGRKNGISLGTTIVIGLFTTSRYYILNVGDSRAYEIREDIKIITEDQTVVENEVKAGKITREQAKTDMRRSVLLQCVGASITVNPDMFFGETKKNTVYMFCSDGFRHEISEEEIFGYLNPNVSINEAEMTVNANTLINLNKQRNEKDNISVAFIRTY